MQEPRNVRDQFELALTQNAQDVYRLNLYVSGASQRSIEAIANVKSLCEQYLKNRYELQIIDLYQQPGVAAAEQLWVAPTLIKKSPLPVRRLIGTLGDLQNVLTRLDIAPI